MTKIFTAQLRYGGKDSLNVTTSGKDPIGKAFAPGWRLVNGIKNNTMSEESYIAEYAPMVKKALNANAGYLKSLKEVTLTCFCPAGAFCHRVIMAEMMEELGFGVYNGEVDLRPNKSFDCVKGDILDMENGIICHQVNAMGKMGAGIALQIRKKYPKVYDVYRHYTSVDTRERLSLGKIMLCMGNPDKQDGLYPIIANLCAQHRYGRDKRYTNYTAMRRCLKKLSEWTLAHEQITGNRPPIYFPWKMGCSLAGGDWYLVYSMIKDVFPNSTIVRRTKW